MFQLPLNEDVGLWLFWSWFSVLAMIFTRDSWVQCFECSCRLICPFNFQKTVKYFLHPSSEHSFIDLYLSLICNYSVQNHQQRAWMNNEFVCRARSVAQFVFLRNAWRTLSEDVEETLRNLEAQTLFQQLFQDVSNTRSCCDRVHRQIEFHLKTLLDVENQWRYFWGLLRLRCLWTYLPSSPIVLLLLQTVALKRLWESRVLYLSLCVQTTWDDSLLKGDEVLLVLVVCFAMGDVCDVHHCRHRQMTDCWCSFSRSNKRNTFNKTQQNSGTCFLFFQTCFSFFFPG